MYFTCIFLMKEGIKCIGILCLLASLNPLRCGAAPSYREDAEECNTPVCHEAAEYLRNSMNTSVDPCNNFYQYTCGGWIAKNPIPEEKSRYTAFDVTYYNLLDTLAGELAPSSAGSDIKSVGNAAKYFQGCINKDAREQQGLEPLKNALASIGGWPMVDSEWTDSGSQWQARLATVIRTLGVKPIISVFVDADANETSQHILYLDQPNFGLGRNQLIDLASSDRDIKVVAGYKAYIKSSALLLNPNVDSQQLDKDIEDMIQFESALAKVSKADADRRDAEEWYNKINVDQAQRVAGNSAFSLMDFLNTVVEEFPSVTTETEVIIKEQNYIKNAITLATARNPRVVSNYIGWIVVMNIGHQTTKAFRDAQFEFEKIQMGIEKQEKLERVCALQTVSLLGYAVGRLYVDKYFTQEAKQDADRMVEAIRTSYDNTLMSNTWMDTNTRDRAVEKLRSMVNMMGYPPWIKVDDTLNEYYISVPDVNPDAYFTAFVGVTKAIQAKELKKWNQLTDRANDWITTPPVVNAFYNPNANTITFPAGILDLPFYKYGRSLALNFGGMGNVIGHEMSHGFDDQGSQYDKEGNLVNWWSKETKDQFKDRANCFRNQYSSYIEPTTNMHLNGNATVGENIADNGALRNAFIAYQTEAQLSGDKKLPGISASPEQLFFMGFASLWCGTERKESLEYSIQYFEHTTNEFRAIVPLTNSKEFSKAFNCPIGSPMNPESKCELW